MINVQRGGPSTGLPTKAEQSDLLQVMYARNGESPLPVIAAQSPSDCFYAAYEAARMALVHRMPVILLTDGYLANSAEPWLVPDVDLLAPIDVVFTTEPNTPEGFAPYLHDPETLARPWALPGTPGLAHRLGGLEKWDVSGNISYDGENHHHMTELRHAKVAAVAKTLPQLQVDHDQGAELLVLGWGSTYGPIRAAVNRLRREHGRPVARAHLRNIAPLPDDLGEIMARYKRVLLPENNMGQLAMILRAKYLVDVKTYNRVTGLPFRSDELVERMLDQLNDLAMEGLA
ncbi:MAG: 2-oxoglutarate ferredoxin oxidoreductase subunit alpha [Glaciecola sp.]